MNNKKYILVCQATRYLLIDILNVFAENNCEIILYTGEVRIANTPLNSKIIVKKLIYYNSSTIFKRLFTWLVFTFQCFFLLLFKSKKHEVIYVTTPPFLVFLGLFFKKLFNQTFHLLIWDLYPDVMVNFNVIKRNGYIHRIWSKSNKYIFNNASNVFTISESMAEAINKYSANIKVKIIPNWVDSRFITPLEKTNNPFAIQFHQTDKLTVMYSGNFGETHDLESIIEVAKMNNNKNISFFIIGEGAKKKKIEDLIKKDNIDNITILPLQSSEILPYSLTTADIGVVTLGEGAENVSVPSKTYYMMAAGTAILALANKNSELSRLVNKYEIGRVIRPGDIQNIIIFVNEMYQNKIALNKFKQNSRNASFNFTPENAKKYFEIINSLNS
ncbi:MAG: glycosyltransferase family 4 protein [Bacteroidetes bacterium]|nr:glycosyltransferase family 4 protein [Bacteroidota bacterium]